MHPEEEEEEEQKSCDSTILNSQRKSGFPQILSQEAHY